MISSVSRTCCWPSAIVNNYLFLWSTLPYSWWNSRGTVRRKGSWQACVCRTPEFCSKFKTWWIIIIQFSNLQKKRSFGLDGTYKNFPMRILCKFRLYFPWLYSDSISCNNYLYSSIHQSSCCPVLRILAYALEVKFEFKLKLLNLGWFSTSLVSQS